MARMLRAFKASLSVTLMRSFYPVSRNITSSFFNRNREMEVLLSGLQDKPTFNSEKLTLLRTLTKKKLRNQHVSLLDMNLRSVRLSFNCVDTFVSTLEHKGASWLQQFKKSVKHFKLAAKACGLEL